MNDDEIKRRWREAVAFPQQIEREWLLDHCTGHDEHWNFYRPCPICLDHTHTGQERRLPGGKGLGVYCPVTEAFRVIKAIDIIAVIEKEERKFNALLERWKGKIPERLTAEEAFLLRTEQGVPEELFLERMEDEARYQALIEAHRVTSGDAFRKSVF